MTDDEIPDDGVEELCEFWEWALATKRELEERVAEWSDPHHPRWESIEQDIVAMAEAQCESAKAITENRSEFRKFWRSESERELRIAKDELQRFLYGPVGRSHSGRPLPKEALVTKRRKPRSTALSVVARAPLQVGEGRASAVRSRPRSSPRSSAGKKKRPGRRVTCRDYWRP